MVPFDRSYISSY